MSTKHDLFCLLKKTREKHDFSGRITNVTIWSIWIFKTMGSSISGLVKKHSQEWMCTKPRCNAIIVWLTFRMNGKMNNRNEWEFYFFALERKTELMTSNCNWWFQFTIQEKDSHSQGFHEPSFLPERFEWDYTKEIIAVQECLFVSHETQILGNLSQCNGSQADKRGVLKLDKERGATAWCTHWWQLNCHSTS